MLRETWLFPTEVTLLVGAGTKLLLTLESSFETGAEFFAKLYIGSGIRLEIHRKKRPDKSHRAIATNQNAT